MDARQRGADGRLEPSPTVTYIVQNFKAQTACPHPYENLKWGEHEHAMYATCKMCELKPVIFNKKREYS